MTSRKRRVRKTLTESMKQLQSWIGLDEFKKVQKRMTTIKKRKRRRRRSRRRRRTSRRRRRTSRKMRRRRYRRRQSGGGPHHEEEQHHKNPNETVVETQDSKPTPSAATLKFPDNTYPGMPGSKWQPRGQMPFDPHGGHATGDYRSAGGSRRRRRKYRKNR